MIQRVFLIVTVFLVFAAAAQAQQAIPPLTGRVMDRAGILSPSTENALTSLLETHEAETSNQVVVLTVTRLEGEAIEDFSIRVAQSWGLGTAENDNGVLLLVAASDRELRIEVGFGLEATLTDVLASRIIRNDIVPLFKQGDYDAGVLIGIQSILGVIEGTYTPVEASSSEGDAPPMFMRVMFALMFIAMPLFFFVPSFLIAGQWGNLGFMGIFIVVGGFICFFSLMGVVITALTYMGLLLLANGIFRRQENWAEMRKEVAEALKENRGRRVKVTIAGFTFNAGGITSNSGSGGRSRGGGFSSGGGFSGGGGSFGGGGSSGSW